MKKALIGVGVIVIAVFILSVLAGSNRPASNTGTGTNQVNSQVNQADSVTQTPQQTPQYTYSSDNNSVVENYFVTLSTSTEDKESAARAAIEDIKKLCSRKCNISVYDDAEAKSIDKKNLNNPPTSPQEQDAWDKENYVYVADHLIAFKSFEEDETTMSPYKDWKYKELKGEK